MRDKDTDRLLTDVRRAVIAAREAGIPAKSCVWDATVAAVDVRDGWPSGRARALAKETALVVQVTELNRPGLLRRTLCALGLHNDRTDAFGGCSPVCLHCGR